MKSGYTLIEILVVLTIIAILFGFGYVSYRDFSRRQALTGIVRQVQGDLRLAQQMALSGQKPDNDKCTGANTLNGYNFKILSFSSPAEYEIIADCTGGVLTDIDDAAKVVTLPAYTSVSTSLNPIFFKVLGQGTNISDAGAVMTITQTQLNYSLPVVVTTGGEIR